MLSAAIQQPNLNYNCLFINLKYSVNSHVCRLEENYFASKKVTNFLILKKQNYHFNAEIMLRCEKVLIEHPTPPFPAALLNLV